MPHRKARLPKILASRVLHFADGRPHSVVEDPKETTGLQVKGGDVVDGVDEIVGRRSEFNRPTVNAFIRPMVEATRDAIAAAVTDDEVRVVVLASAVDGFAAPERTSMNSKV